VSGHLRAHPYQRFQKDAGLGVILKNSVIAAGAALGATNRARALSMFDAEVRQMARELDDARALTWSSDLSDTFGRSQTEIRSLIEALEKETETGGQRASMRRRSLVPAGPTSASADSPYLAL
jgi:hypothetical protein